MQTRQYAPEHLANVMAAVREPPPQLKQIGPYKIEALLGEGGMGQVFRAEQFEPIRRTVAIKVIKLGMDTREVIARFESERQALALMDHPNVARVIDAGATETGRPYFVMEFVEGETITSFADRNKLTLSERLGLFAQACEAIQHAHQKAIIHRDLKPSNILVTRKDGVPIVKVIDFGIAKAIDQRLTEKSLFTQAGQLMGTPEYMAPEQADGKAIDVDTRTDVYALGVVLYELLIGALPFESRTLRSAGYNEIQRIIREVDPPRMSAKLSKLGASAQAIAQLRQIDLNLLHQQLKRELEWIPLKAMRKERDQRYASARELAEDIGNYLAHRPLRAGPESRAYRARKFLRRNQRGMAALAAMFLLLITGIIATSWQAIRATRAERVAIEQKRQAEQAKAATAQVNTFLVEMFGSVSPKVAQGKNMLVRDVLEAATKTLPTKFATEPQIESAIRTALGQTYLALGLYEQAEEHLAKSRDIDARELGPDDPQSLMSAQLFGLVRRQRGHYEEARDIYRANLDRRRRVLGDRHIETLNAMSDLAVALDLLGSPDAEAKYREAREGMIATIGRDKPATLRVTGNLGQLLQRIGRFEESEQLLRESYEGRKRVLGQDDPETIGISSRLAYVLRNTKKWDEAETLMREALENSRRVNGENHATTIFTENGLAQVLCDRGKNDEGIALYLHSLEQSKKHLGMENTNTFAIMQAAATAMANAGRAAEAERLLLDAADGLRKLRGPDHPLTITAEMNYCLMLQTQKRWEESLPLAKHGYEVLREPGKVQLSPGRRARYLAAYGIALSQLARHAEAIEPLTVAREAFREQRDDNQVLVENVLRDLVASSDALNRPQDAARWRGELESATTRPTQSTTAPTTRSS